MKLTPIEVSKVTGIGVPGGTAVEVGTGGEMDDLATGTTSVCVCIEVAVTVETLEYDVVAVVVVVVNESSPRTETSKKKPNLLIPSTASGGGKRGGTGAVLSNKRCTGYANERTLSRNASVDLR